jgi:transglutaminase-like putative cysteine protease
LRPFTTLCILFASLMPALAQGDAPSASSNRPVWIDPGYRINVMRETVRFDEDGVETREFEFDLIALDERSARGLAQQTFPYDGYLSELTVSELATIKQDGRIIPVDVRAIVDQPVGVDPTSPYIDEYRAKIVAYSDVQPFDRIRGKTTSRGKRPRVKGEVMGVWTWPSSNPRGPYEIRVSLPASMQAKVHASGVDLRTSVADGRIEHLVTFDNETPITSTIDERSVGVAKRLEISTFTDYPALAAVMNALNAPMARPDEAIIAMSNTIVGDASDSRIKASRIHNWVAKNIRYIGIGLQDGGYKSEPAGAVLAAMYGDCKAHATLLKALLAVQGIEANFVLINAGDDFSLPHLAVSYFDHAIVYLPAFDLYADPTSQLVAFGALPIQLYSKPVLNLDKGVLATVPAMRAQDNVWQTSSDFTLGADGLRKGASRFQSNSARLRSIAMEFETIDKELWARRAIRSWKLEGRGDFEFSNPRDLSASFSITAPFELTSPVDMSAASTIQLAPFTNIVPSISWLTSGQVRERTFRCYPLDFKQTASLALPASTLLTERPANFATRHSFKGTTAYGEVSGTISISGEGKLEGETFQLERRAIFDFDAPICPASFGAEIDVAFAKWDDAQGLKIGLSPNAAGLSASDGSKLGEGLNAYRSGDFDKAFPLLLPFAEKGDVEAQLRVAFMYRDGKGVQADQGLAFRWHAKAADAGNAYAEEQMGWAYETGRGTARSFQQAASMYEKAALKGRAYAQSRLGVFYRYGSGLPQDYGRSIDWLMKAVDQGYGPALTDLAFMHENGLGTPKDLSRAKTLYEEASRRGDKKATERLATIKSEIR